MTYIDYKDTDLLRKFISDRGKDPRPSRHPRDVPAVVAAGQGDQERARDGTAAVRHALTCALVPRPAPSHRGPLRGAAPVLSLLLTCLRNPGHTRNDFSGAGVREGRGLSVGSGRGAVTRENWRVHVHLLMHLVEQGYDPDQLTTASMATSASAPPGSDLWTTTCTTAWPPRNCTTWPGRRAGTATRRGPAWSSRGCRRRRGGAQLPLPRRSRARLHARRDRGHAAGCQDGEFDHLIAS